MEGIPDWVNDTPEERLCELVMWEGVCNGIQSVQVSREEYIALKQHLAVMRGYVTRDSAAKETAALNLHHLQ